MYPTISNARNAELRLRWGQIVLKNDHQGDFWKVKEFLQSQVGPHCLVPWGLWAERRGEEEPEWLRRHCLGAGGRPGEVCGPENFVQISV